MTMIVETSCIFLGLLALYLWFSRRKPKGAIIKGPKGVPILGSAPEITDENILDKFMDYANEFGEIFRVKLLWNNVIVLNSSDIIRKAFTADKYKKYFNDRPALFYGEHLRCGNKSLVFIPKGWDPSYTVSRKTFIKALHVYGTGIADLEQKVAAEIARVTERIEKLPGKEFECVELFKRSLSNVISIVLSGEPISDEDPCRDIFWERAYVFDFFCNQFNNTVMTLLPFMRVLPTRYRDMYQKGKYLNALIAQRYFYDIKKTHVPGEGNGIVHVYLDEQKKESESGKEPFFTDDRIHAMMYETIVAGIVTTLSALTSSFLILMNFPEYQTKIQEELDRHVGHGRLPSFADRAKCTFIKAFELEVHRFVPVLPLLLPHLCVEHVEFEGLDIEPNSTVIANMWYVHHDEKVWGDPWTFRPERFLDERGDLLPFDHLYMKSVMSFGIGQRQCAAELFAKTRYFLYIATLLQRWRFEFPPGKERTCDPRSAEAFETKATMTAKPFFCCARDRKV